MLVGNEPQMLGRNEQRVLLVEAEFDCEGGAMEAVAESRAADAGGTK